MLRAGVLPEMPLELQEALSDNSQEFDIEFLGPLARAQKSSDVISTGRWLDSFIGLAQLKPDIIDNVNTDFIPRNNARLLGVPSEALNSKEDVEASRQARAKAQEEERDRIIELQQAEVAAKAAGATARQGRE
jgi:hypothetical protein